MSEKTFKRMSGHLRMKVSHKWVSYEFRTDGVYFHYFENSKPKGHLFKQDLLEVKPSAKSHKGAENCFEVHHSGAGPPWILSAATRENCIQWMESLQPGSSLLLKASSPHSPPPHSPGYQQTPHNGYQQASLHESLNMGSPHSPNSYKEDTTQSMNAGSGFGGGALSSHPTVHTPKTPDVYEYMSSKGVPQPEEDNAYDDSVPSSTSSVNHEKDFLRYFSPEQMRQLAEMFNEVVGVDKPKQLQKQFSSSELVTALRKTSQSIPDQILNQEGEYVIGEDDVSTKWAFADSRPDGKQLDKLPEVEDIYDTTYLQKEEFTLQREEFTIQREALSDFREIGKGQYGVVEAALYRPSPDSAPIKVAIKKTKETCSQLDKDNFYKEIVVMAQFMHPNIVRVFGSVDKGVSSPWLVLEFLSNGDLKTFLERNKRPVHRLVKYMVDIAMGMHYLSEKNFVHRDLAARNVFMDENELCKVGDFGLLRETTRRDDNKEKHYLMQSQLALPVRWMAVECLTKQMFSSASDVWSFGILMWELFNPEDRPYRDLDNMSVIAAVSSGQQKLDIPENCPKTVQQVMQACWNADSTKRPSFLVIANRLCRCMQQETPSKTQ